MSNFAYTRTGAVDLPLRANNHVVTICLLAFVLIGFGSVDLCVIMHSLRVFENVNWCGVMDQRQ